MKLVERTFKFDTWVWMCRSGRDRLGLCSDDVRVFLDRFFAVPDDDKIESLIFSLHDRRSVNRIEVEVVRIEDDRQDDGWFPKLKWGRGFDNEHTSPSLDPVLKPFAGRKFWLQVEYVEK